MTMGADLQDRLPDQVLVPEDVASGIANMNTPEEVVQEGGNARSDRWEAENAHCRTPITASPADPPRQRQSAQIEGERSNDPISLPTPGPISSMLPNVAMTKGWSRCHGQHHDLALRRASS
jgi:hypothetical protein